GRVRPSSRGNAPFSPISSRSRLGHSAIVCTLPVIAARRRIPIDSSHSGTTMKTFKIKRLAATLLLASLSGAALADSDDGTCSNATLRGLYVFTATGFTIVAGVAQPKAIVEPIRFFGDGTLNTPGSTRSVNGVIA